MRGRRGEVEIMGIVWRVAGSIVLIRRRNCFGDVMLEADYS